MAKRLTPAVAPALFVPSLFGDTNVSAGVIGLVVAILVLVVVLLAVIVIEITGEHRTNAHDRHEHRA